MAEALAVPALCVAIGGVDPLNPSGQREMSDGSPHGGDVARVNCDDHRSGSFTKAGIGVGLRNLAAGRWTFLEL